MDNAKLNDDVRQAIRSDIMSQLLVHPKHDGLAAALKKLWLRETAAMWKPQPPVPVFLTEFNEGDAAELIKTEARSLALKLSYEFSVSPSEAISEHNVLTFDSMSVTDEWFEIDATPIIDRINTLLKNQINAQANVIVLNVSNVHNPVSLKLIDRAIRFSFNQQGIAALVVSTARKPPLGENEGYRGYFKHFTVQGMSGSSSTGGGVEKSPLTVGEW